MAKIRSITAACTSIRLLILKHQEAAERALREGLVASEKRRGFKPTLEKLDKDKYEEFYRRSNVPEALLVPGRWLKALVQEVGPAGAVVRFGDKYGLIPAEDMSWAKGKVEAGDLVWASVTAIPDKGGAGKTRRRGERRQTGRGPGRQEGQARRDAPGRPGQSRQAHVASGHAAGAAYRRGHRVHGPAHRRGAGLRRRLLL